MHFCIVIYMCVGCMQVKCMANCSHLHIWLLKFKFTFKLRARVNVELKFPKTIRAVAAYHSIWGESEDMLTTFQAAKNKQGV